MPNLRSMLLVLVAVPLFAASTASADLCKSAKITIKNDKAKTIKVTKIQYYDGCDKKWRTEDVPAREIQSGSSVTYTENLEYVGNCSVSKFKIYRAPRNATGSAYGAFAWGGELPVQGGAKTCNTGVSYVVRAHD